MPQTWNHTGFGTLGFTWRPTLIPDTQAFPCFRAAIASGATIFSTSSVYGPASNPLAGLQLLARYFAAYPEDMPKVTLFIRGCFDAKTFSPMCDRAGVRASFEEAEEVFRAVGKKIDVFGPARMDQEVAVEETIGAVKELVDEGRVGGVGLSEVRAETIRKARKVCEIVFCEVEFSMWTQEMLGNGVAEAARECGVVLLSYSPLGYGFLTGELRRLEDIPEGDGRLRLGRFQQDTFYQNIAMADKIKEYASSLGMTPAQLALGWIRAHSNTGICGTVIPIPGATKLHRVEENCTAVPLSPEKKAELDEILSSFTVVGHRQMPNAEKFLLT